MCTALNITTKNHYFGRNLDLDCSYGEEVCIIPRNFPLCFRKEEAVESHYAMIGMATVVEERPLFYDANNEHGLSMAGLNFPDNAFYPSECEGKDNIAPFEFIPWIMGKCRSVGEARALLERINLVNIPFSEKLPLSPLHWIISDRNESIVAEPMKDGLHIYGNPVGILTNNPPFEYHMFNLNNYRHLRTDNGEDVFLPELPLKEYCRGLGGIGLPGDVSSMSRFVRIAFGKANSVCGDSEEESVSQFFHLLSSVEMCRGVCRAETGKWDITVYSSCVNADRGMYYYNTYDNRQIQCVDMHCADLEGSKISRFALNTVQQIYYHN